MENVCSALHMGKYSNEIVSNDVWSYVFGYAVVLAASEMAALHTSNNLIQNHKSRTIAPDRKRAELYGYEEAKVRFVLVLENMA